MKKTLLIFIPALLIILSGCAQSQPQTSQPGLDAFAECISESGAKMYGTEWCSHCKDQKERFKGSFSKINYIDCDKKSAQCSIAGVKGFPTWIFAGGEKLPGAQTLETLADKTGCKLPE